MTVIVNFQIVHPDAKIPTRGSSGAAGWDIYAIKDQPIRPHSKALIDTGLNIALPAGYEAQVRPRSGLAHRHMITVLNSPGTIDEDYRGRLGVILINHGEDTFTVCKGERIAQLVIQPTISVYMVAVDDLSDTERGTGGFGSTGA